MLTCPVDDRLLGDSGLWISCLAHKTEKTPLKPFLLLMAQADCMNEAPRIG